MEVDGPPVCRGKLSVQGPCHSLPWFGRRVEVQEPLQNHSDLSTCVDWWVLCHIGPICTEDNNVGSSIWCSGGNYCGHQHLVHVSSRGTSVACHHPTRSDIYTGTHAPLDLPSTESLSESCTTKYVIIVAGRIFKPHYKPLERIAWLQTSRPVSWSKNPTPAQWIPLEPLWFGIFSPAHRWTPLAGCSSALGPASLTKETRQLKGAL